MQRWVIKAGDRYAKFSGGKRPDGSANVTASIEWAKSSREATKFNSQEAAQTTVNNLGDTSQGTPIVTDYP